MSFGLTMNDLVLHFAAARGLRSWMPSCGGRRTRRGYRLSTFENSKLEGDWIL